MATVYDVAARAGVSPATVSRVFNGIRVTPDRLEAVRLAGDELGNVPNRNARRLRTNSSQIITPDGSRHREPLLYGHDKGRRGHRQGRGLFGDAV